MRGNRHVPSLLDAIVRKTPDAPIGYQHTKRDIMVKHRKLGHDLLVKRQPARTANKFRLREESVVESHPPPDAIPLLAEPKPRHHHEIDEIHRHRLAFDRLANA